MPRPDEAFACGSASITSTFFSNAASDAARFIAVVVLPTPPFWFANAMIFPILSQLFSIAVTVVRHSDNSSNITLAKVVKKVSRQ